jgi:hypothetical protein
MGKNLYILINIHSRAKEGSCMPTLQPAGFIKLSTVSAKDLALWTSSLSCILNLICPPYDQTDFTRMSSEKDRNWAWVAGERSSKMLNLLRTRLEVRSVVVGRAVFLNLNTRDNGFGVEFHYDGGLGSVLFGWDGERVGDEEVGRQ